MANHTTTTAAKWIDKVWSGDFDLGAQEEMVFAGKIYDFGAMHGEGHIPKFTAPSATTLAAGSGGSLTGTANTETETTLTPASSYVMYALEEQMLVRAMADPQNATKKMVQMCIGAAVDAACLVDVASLTTNVVGDGTGNFDKSMILDGVQKLASGAKQYFKPGQTNGIFVIHPAQIDDLLGISDVTSAQVRGDSANPTVSGWVAKAFGCEFYESGSVYTSGGVAYNVAFIPKAFAVGYNQRPAVKVQEFELLTKIICWTDYAHAVHNDSYGVQIKTLAA